MRYLFLIAVTLGIGWMLYSNTAERSYEPPPAFKAAMDRAAKQAHDDINGPLGESAIAACRRVAGVTGPARTGKQIVDAGYSAETAMKFTDCVVNYMYPVDAKKTEELDRKAGIR